MAANADLCPEKPAAYLANAKPSQIWPVNEWGNCDGRVSGSLHLTASQISSVD